jgi:hypothetical protein
MLTRRVTFRLYPTRRQQETLHKRAQVALQSVQRGSV